MSKHYKEDRRKREKLVNRYLNGNGKVIDTFIVDRGHPKGLERHEITENGVILVYNAETNKFVTKLIARPHQIKRYYMDVGREPPSNLLVLAKFHKDLGYNK